MRRRVVLSKPLDVLQEIIRRPGYREYLWYKLGGQLGFIPQPKLQRANLSLPGGVVPPLVGQPVDATIMIRDQLFEKSPYDGFDPRPHPDDVQGWASDAPMLVQAVQLLRPTRICEVGSWKGRSAINMARAVKTLNLSAEIVCVDTWLGSPEHWLNLGPQWYPSLRISNGMPQLYYTFLANVVRSEVTDIITPFPTTSENAAVIFEKLGIKFDLVYIDAAHEYEPAKRDISAYYDLLQDDGLLIGDDYIGWAGVTKAADDFASERNLRILGTWGKFIIPKGQKYANLVLG
jgi:SAM-dependent methyltransferase